MFLKHLRLLRKNCRAIKPRKKQICKTSTPSLILQAVLINTTLPSEPPKGLLVVNKKKINRKLLTSGSHSKTTSWSLLTVILSKPSLSPHILYFFFFSPPLGSFTVSQWRIGATLQIKTLHFSLQKKKKKEHPNVKSQLERNERKTTSKGHYYFRCDGWRNDEQLMIFLFFLKMKDWGNDSHHDARPECLAASVPMCSYEYSTERGVIPTQRDLVRSPCCLICLFL